jgi:hypothetical protein
MTRHTLAAAALIALLAPAARAQRSTQSLATTTVPAHEIPPRATASAASASRTIEPPVLDGRTNDPAWLNAQVIDQFLETQPQEGKESRFKTEVRVTYDDKFLYVLTRMFDPAPDSIISALSRRDVRTNSEQITLVVDSYHDRKTAYEFNTNPAGVKRDYYVTSDGNEDGSWDGVWDVATRVDSLGWVAEFRIPFSQVRFAPGAEHTFGFLVIREIARTGQRNSWPLLKHATQGFVSQAGTLSGIGDLPSPRRLEVLPYTVVKNATRDFGDRGPRGRYEHPNQITAGADLKYGISSGLTLDATINPDFGQVEADPAQLNLTAFETFFDERRPFFLEGAGIFNFNTSCGDIDSGCTGLFYSRRIGRNPQLAGNYGDESSATATPIAAAGKLTGRLANGISVGLLDAVTQRLGGIGSVDGLPSTIEPRTNYNVLRLQKDNTDGQGDMGVMLTGVNRSLDPSSSPFLRNSAYVGGVDLRRRFWHNNYEVKTFAAMSDVSGTAASIAALQTNTVHDYQRPDDDVVYDPTRTTLRGDAERISFSKFGGDITRFQTVYQRFRNWFALQLNTPTRLYQRAFFNFNYAAEWTTGGLMLDNGINHNNHIQWKNYWWTHVGFNLNGYQTSYDDRTARGGPAIRNAPNQSMWAGIESDSRRSITGGLFFNGGRGDEGRSFNASVNPHVNFRMSSRLSTSLGVSFRRNASDAQYYGTYGAVTSDTTHYTFARLDQTTTSVNTRLNFTATPNLSFQFYAEPFVSNGTYADWKEIADPRAAQYADRFKRYQGTGAVFDGFNYRQFNSNAVVRYEYRPGSTLFVVWQQGRNNYVVPGDLNYNPNYSFSRDYGSPLRDHPNNTFLVKFSYWLNP